MALFRNMRRDRCLALKEAKMPPSGLGESLRKGSQQGSEKRNLKGTRPGVFF